MKVLVFARAPQPGRCKTRLIPLLGSQGAASLQRDLALRTIDTARRSAASVELWCAPDTRHGFFRACRRAYGVRLRRQPRGDLGRRMRIALQQGPALLIGTDCPSLSPSDLRSAWKALERADCVLQPSTDGGYVLIGARRIETRALSGIEWSSGREQAQTLARMRRVGLRCVLLPPRADVDTPADYRRERRKGQL